MMRTHLPALLLVCLLLLSMTACVPVSDNEDTADSVTATAVQEDSVISPVCGEWINEDGSTTLQINEDGQIVYTVNGEVLLRGYLTEKLPSDGESSTVRYSFFNDADLLMMRYSFDPAAGVLTEENTDGVTVDQYSRK